MEGVGVAINRNFRLSIQIYAEQEDLNDFFFNFI